LARTSANTSGIATNASCKAEYFQVRSPRPPLGSGSALDSASGNHPNSGAANTTSAVPVDKPPKKRPINSNPNRLTTPSPSAPRFGVRQQINALPNKAAASGNAAVPPFR